MPSLPSRLSDAHAGERADTRMIQALIGHAKLETIQIYTHLSIKQLQQVHEATHPSEEIGKRNGELAEGEQ